MKRMSDELNRLLEQSYDDIELFDFNGKHLSCIMIPEQSFDHIFSSTVGVAHTVDTDLDVLQDGCGHVFVELILTFSTGPMEKFLINAQKHLDFFEALEKHMMIMLSPLKPSHGQYNMIGIQLPKPTQVARALDVIKRGLASCK